VTGNYLINATYAGDSTHSRASTIVNLAVTPFASQDTQEVFSVASNSTVSDLVFNSTSRELSFTVTGISGTTGYVEVNIAKTLVDDITSVKAYIDGNGIEYTTTSTADSWLLQFNYHHSTHTIILDLGQTEPESLAEISQAPLAVGGAIGVVAIAATIVVTKKKAPKKVNAEYVNKHSLAE
jgi:predicted amino acid dehydrogenase